MDIFDRIMEDHDRYRDLLEAAEDAAEDNPAESLELYDEIYREIMAHHITEEHTVFPVLLEKEETREDIEEFIEEHQAINRFLGYLQEADKSVRWEAKIEVLEELIEHHLEEEEEDMFPGGRKVLTQEELTGLIDQFNARKQEELDKLA